MAEIALIASIIQIADIGIRLSLRLYTFGETVASADRSILNISKDIAFTSSVLKELGRTFENDQGRVHSDNATSTADGMVKECSNIFVEMETLLLKKAPSLGANMDKRNRAKILLERLRWSVIKGKVELLNCSLDRMKSTLTLMLNVILYAQQVSQRYH